MWLLVFIFVAITLILGWTLFGYFMFVFILGLFAKKHELLSIAEYPLISVIVPCYNEEKSILDKLNNIKELDYPADKIEVIFADGNSNDKTFEIIEKELAGINNCKIVKCPRKGKINQLNYVLSIAKGEIILNTDVDGLLDKNALKWIAAEFSADPKIYVVGSYCYPNDTLQVEHYYWSAQNKARFLETYAHSASIVVAQCYAFRKGVITQFPDDVVADDVYAGFHANTIGGKVVYSYLSTAFETRTPKSYSEFIPHKFRKSNAFLRESLRFLYKLPEMSGFVKMMFLTRIAQQLLLPWAVLSWLLVAGVLLTLFRYDIVILGALLLFSLFIITSIIFSSVKLPDRHHKYSFATIVKGYLITNFIMLTTGLSYPFYKQDSSYNRLNK